MIKKNPAYNLSTERFSTIAQAKPASVRVRLCRTGSYFGVTPKKLPNGRLTWPEDSEDRLYAAAADPEAA